MERELSLPRINMAESDLIFFDVSAPGYVTPFGDGILRKESNVLCCAVNLRVRLMFQEDKKKMFELHLENYKHTISFSYEAFNKLLSHLPPLCKSLPVSSYSWETPELINLDKMMPLVIDFVSSITQTTPQDLYHEFALYDFFLIAAGILCSVNVDFTPFSVFIKSDIPTGITVGNSSAHSVCIASAFLHYLRMKALKTGRMNVNISKSTCKTSKIGLFTIDAFDANEKDVIFKWSCLSEKLIPRATYGIGSSISTYGEMIKFTKGADEFRPSVRPLTHIRVINILIVDSGEKADRERLKKELDAFAEMFPDIMEPISMLQEMLSEMTVDLLAESVTSLEDTRLGILGIGDLLELDHFLYVAMNLISPIIDDVWKTVNEAGFKSKAIGPGFGGSFIIHLPSSIQEQKIRGLKTRLTKKGYTFIETEMNVNGLKLTNRN